MSMLERIGKRRQLIWAIVVPLAICLVYSLFYLASSLGFSLFVLSSTGVEQTVDGIILSNLFDVAIWGTAVFIILALLGYDLELNMVKGYYRSIAGVGLLVTICSMAIGVCLVFIGFVSMVAMVPISFLLLSMCVVFSSDFFGVNRLPFSLKLLFGGLIIGLLVELAGFLV